MEVPRNLDINLRQLQQFIAVGEELHFGRAALRLGMHQAPLSQAIQKMEVSLGLQLFGRTHRNVSLTPAGVVLLEEAREIVDRARRFTQTARWLGSGERGSLTIGFVSTAMYGYLPEVVRTFRERYPEVELQLREATSDVQLRQLESEELDIGFVIGAAAASPGNIRSRQVRTDRLIVAVPASWAPSRYAHRNDRSAQLEALIAEPLLIFPRRVGPVLFDAILECYTQRGLTPVRGQEAIQMQTILGLVAAGLGYAVVPASMRILARPDVRFLDIAGAVPQVALHIAWRTSDPSPVCANFVQLVTIRGAS